MPSNVPGTRLESKSNIILENTLLRVHRRRMQEIPCSVNIFWISMSHPGLSIHVSTSVDPEIEMETVSFQGHQLGFKLEKRRARCLFMSFSAILALRLDWVTGGTRTLSAGTQNHTTDIS